MDELRLTKLATSLQQTVHSDSASNRASQSIVATRAREHGSTHAREQWPQRCESPRVTFAAASGAACAWSWRRWSWLLLVAGGARFICEVGGAMDSFLESLVLNLLTCCVQLGSC